MIRPWERKRSAKQRKEIQKAAKLLRKWISKKAWEDFFGPIKLEGKETLLDVKKGEETLCCIYCGMPLAVLRYKPMPKFYGKSLPQLIKEAKQKDRY